MARFSWPQLGEGLSLYRPHCVHGVLQGFCGMFCLPHQTTASLSQSGFPTGLKPSQGIGWVSPSGRDTGWFESLAHQTQSFPSMVFILLSI